jgi:branched-chain amino acid transport system permease protein
VTAFGQAVIFGIMNGSGYILFAAGMALTFGVMRVMNFAHGEIYMMGGMLTYALTRSAGLNIVEAAVLAIIIVAILGLVVNRVVIQPVLAVSAAAPLLATIALSFILLNGAGAIWSNIARIILPSALFGTIRGGGVAISYAGLAVIAAGILIAVGLHVFMAKAPLGKQMRATVQNITGASLVGINTKRIYDFTLIISSALAALGAILLGFIHTVNPAMGQPVLLIGFVIVVVAGMGNLLGAAITAVGVGIVESLLVTYAVPEYAEAMIYVMLIIILLIRPEGLFTRKVGT